jgi:hypothetical protein
MKYYVVKSCVMMNGLLEVNYGIVMIDKDGNRDYCCDISDKLMDMELLVHELNGYRVESQQAREIIEDFKFKKAFESHT